MYEGQIEVDGDEFYEEADAAEKASFRCYLDTGLARTSTGARIFGVLKGCADAGIDIPHSPKVKILQFSGAEFHLAIPRIRRRQAQR